MREQIDIEAMENELPGDRVTVEAGRNVRPGTVLMESYDVIPGECAAVNLRPEEARALARLLEQAANVAEAQGTDWA